MTTTGQGIKQALKEEAIQPTIDWKAEFVPSLHQSHVLVVDDDWGVRKTLMMLLSAAASGAVRARSITARAITSPWNRIPESGSVIPDVAVAGTFWRWR